MRYSILHRFFIDFQILSCYIPFMTYKKVMCMNIFPQQNQSYQFYYDESNNVRKLYLSKQIDGYNIDYIV